MPLRIMRFFKEYRPSKAEPGKMEEVDMVEYCASNADPARSLTKAKVVNVLDRLVELVPNDNNIASKLAHGRAAAIRPAYLAWKEGHETPVSGTSISSWPGVSPEQAELLKGIGMRTVEDVRDMSESVIARIPFPGARELRANADRFLASSDTMRIAHDLQRKDGDIASLKAEIEALREMVRAAADKPQSRSPGRPRKDQTETEVVAA